MMKKAPKILFALLIATLLTGLTGCQTAEPNTSELTILTPSKTAQNTTAKAPTPSPAMPTCTAAPENEPTQETASPRHYQLDASLNFLEHSLTVSETIDYTNNTGISLDSLPLVIPPADVPDAFSLISLQISPEQADASSAFDGERLWISFATPLPPDGQLSISLLFQLQVPKGESPFGYTDRQLLLADWYAFIPPYLPETGWLINPPGEVGEYLAYPLADFSVNLRLSPSLEGVIVAASAPLTAQDGNCRRYAVQSVRNFTLAASPEYQMFASQRGDVTIVSYTFPEHAGLTARAANIAQSAWALYSQIYTENPRQYMSVVEAEIPDGLECDGLFFLSDGYYAKADDTPQNYFELLVAHEAAHQWFYGSVPNDPAHEPWLDESLATYSELLYLETYAPDLVNWWWEYRVQSFAPTGKVNGTIYDYGKVRPYINATYLRGVSFLQAVRDRIGDKAFFDFLHSYASLEEDHFQTADDFFDLLASCTEQDLSGLIAQYFY